MSTFVLLIMVFPLFSKSKMERCEMVNIGKTNVIKNGENKITYCDIEKCPYGNGLILGLSDNYITICQSEGLVEKSGLIKITQEIVSA